MGKPGQVDPYVVTCILLTLLIGHKRDGYEVKQIYTDQKDDVVIRISTLNGDILTGTLRVTATQ